MFVTYEEIKVDVLRVIQSQGNYVQKGLLLLSVVLLLSLVAFFGYFFWECRRMLKGEQMTYFDVAPLDKKRK